MLLRQLRKEADDMKLDNIIATPEKKVVYRDGDQAIKVFDESYKKSDVLNEALNTARVEETGLAIPQLIDVQQIDGRWAIITEFRNGGMASHGSALGMLLGMWITCRKLKMPYVWWLDRIMIPVAIGGALVRIGNLCNSEIVGRITDLPWGFQFVRLYPGTPLENIPAQHPAQLYEAICYIITFLILLWMYYRRDEGRKRPGLMFGIGVMGIFLTRPFVELVKINQEAFEEGMLLNMGQLLSIPFILLAAYMIWGSLKGKFPVAEPPKRVTKRNKK